MPRVVIAQPQLQLFQLGGSSIDQRHFFFFFFRLLSTLLGVIKTGLGRGGA